MVSMKFLVFIEDVQYLPNIQNPQHHMMLRIELYV